MTTFADNFNRANGAIGAGWVDVDPLEPFLVTDNAARATVADTPALVAVDAAFDDDQEASVTFTAVGVADRAGPAVRVDTANDTAYFVDADGFSGTDRRLVRWAAGVKTVIGAVNIAPVAGDRVTLRAVGSTLTVYVNGALVDTVVDATHASGAPGMYYQRSNTGATRLDDFVGTDAFVKRVGTTQSGGGGTSATRAWNHTTVGTVNPALTIALFYGDIRSGLISITVDGNDVSGYLALSALRADPETHGTLVYVVPGLAPGAHAIAVEYEAVPTFGGPENWYASEETENVNQAQPVRVGADFVEGAGQGITVGPTIPSAAGDLVQGFAAAGGPITASDSLTSRYDNTSSDYKSFVDKPGTAPTATVEYVIAAGANNTYAIGAISLQPPAGGGGTTHEALSCTTGAVAITGQSATLRAHRRLVCSPGAIVLTGQAATLRAARQLVVQAGIVAVTGTQATLRATRQLVAQPGAVTITGVNATLTKNAAGLEALTCTPGTFAIAGQAATLRTHRELVAQPGAVAVSGQAATLAVGRALLASPGAVTISGQLATLRAARRLEAQAGHVTITGQNATLTYSEFVAGTPGPHPLSVEFTPISRSVEFTAITRAVEFTPITRTVEFTDG